MPNVLLHSTPGCLRKHPDRYAHGAPDLPSCLVFLARIRGEADVPLAAGARARHSAMTELVA
eukprot:1113753-Lingulodinium_polyedra.AAC.1